MNVGICILILALSSVTRAERTVYHTQAIDLKAALEVKTWYYVNKNENQKLSELKKSKIKSVKKAVDRRFRIQKDKLNQVISFFEADPSADKSKVAKLKELEKALRSDQLQKDNVADLNKIIDSLIDDLLSAKTEPQVNTTDNLVSQVIKAYNNDSPNIPFVKISFLNDIEVGAHEVTQQEWFEVTGYNPSFFSSKEFCEKEFKISGVTSLCPSLPVENFDYSQVLSFLNKLNRTGQEYRYRLLTKKEYTLISKFIKPSDKDLDKFAWYYENANGQTQAVSSKQKDKLGLYDILGNLYEIVDAGADTEEKSAATKIESFGGSWLTRRHSTIPETFWTIGRDYTCFDVGVRLVRERIIKAKN